MNEPLRPGHKGIGGGNEIEVGPRPTSITIKRRLRVDRIVDGVLSLDDIRLSGKRVLYRVDINSPLHPETGAFLDDGRLRSIIPTLSALSDAKVVILGHQS
ncbi:TPA: phosphoglycerate kinase, partial [Candidatus Thalassarchaeaceae archaeon]